MEPEPDDRLEALIDWLRLMSIESVSIDHVKQPLTLGAGTAQDPFYEPGPMREYRRTGEVVITIKGEII